MELSTTHLVLIQALMKVNDPPVVWHVNRDQSQCTDPNSA